MEVLMLAIYANNQLNTELWMLYCILGDNDLYILDVYVM